MQQGDAILTALLVILALVLVWHYASKKSGNKDGFASFTTFTGYQSPPPYTGGEFNPYTVLNKQLGAIRGYRNDGYDQAAFYRLPQGQDTYNRAGATATPQELSAAERAAWFSAAGTDHASSGGEHTTEGFTDTSAHVTPQNDGMNYGDYVTDLVTDPRTRDNHRRWVEEMQPWSGVARKVDTLEMDNYVDFIGLRRPQAVVQYNPMQLTEIDTSDLAVNPKFNFRG
jgi:hypothetical protein